MELLDIPSQPSLQPPLNTLLRAIPLPASCVITGPPGSGKTVLAVHLARRSAAARPTNLLVASDHLVRRLKATFSTEPDIHVATWRSWLSEAHAEVAGKPVPTRIEAQRRVIDWPQAQATLTELQLNDRQVIIDEAQDVPRELFKLLALHSARVIALADPYQRFAFEGSTLDELVAASSAEDTWPVYILEEDFRTTRQIQRFAARAWAVHRTDMARPSRREGPLPRVVRGASDAVTREAKSMLDLVDGQVVVAATQSDRAELTLALEAAGIQVERGPNPSGGRVRVLAFEALRGLEFSGVIIRPPAAWHESWGTLSAHLYVAATRAQYALGIAVPNKAPEALERSLDSADGTYIQGDS